MMAKASAAIAMALATLWAPVAATAESTCAASGSHPNYFEANLDVYGGNSGAPVAGRQGGHMTVLHDYEAASVRGILHVGSGERLRPGDADTGCADIDEDGRVGLTSLQITLVGDRSEPVVATVTPTSGEIDQSGRYDVRTRFNPDSGLADATGSIQITMWIDNSPPGPRP